MGDEVTRREAITKLAATAGVGALLAAAASEARGADAFHHEARGDDLHVEWGLVHKPNVGSLTVTFKNRFDDPPAVLLTPFWEGSDQEVTHWETLAKVAQDEFKLSAETLGGTTTSVGYTFADR